jgi:hypothetical protein
MQSNLVICRCGSKEAGGSPSRPSAIPELDCDLHLLAFFFVHLDFIFPFPFWKEVGAQKAAPHSSSSKYTLMCGSQAWWSWCFRLTDDEEWIPMC